MTTIAPRGATIRVFLIDGTPQGLRLVDRSQWTGVCLTFSRADYTRVRSRPEINRTGVYLLSGPDATGAGLGQLYVGEGDEVATRLDSHQRGKDFWTHGHILTTTDDSLNKAHVRYLEAKLIKLAKEAGAVRLENGTAPDPPWLSEPERADMDAYLDHMLVLLPIVGVHAFEIVTPRRGAATTSTAATADDRKTYYLKTALTEAEGTDDPRGFTVTEGALGRWQEKVMNPSYSALRNKLLEERVLVRQGEDRVRLTRTFVFDSPSSAASVLSASSKNGRTEWRDAEGRTLAENQVASAPVPQSEAHTEMMTP